MQWINLIIAGLLEIGWTVGLRQMDNHGNLQWTVIFYVSIVSSFYFLQRALTSIPISTAYVIYTSIGALGTVIIGMLFFKEPFSVLRLFFKLLVVGGVTGLKITATH